VSGIPELIIDGATGLLVEPRSPAALAAALARLIADPSLRGTLADAGFERTTMQFSLHSGTDLLAHRFELSLAAA
jgi:glycosyltransferase involved in cell wall biosynthesis